MRSFRLWPGPRGLLPVIPVVLVSVTRPKPSPHLLGLLYLSPQAVFHNSIPSQFWADDIMSTLLT